MNKYKPVIGRASIAYRIHCFCPDSVDMDTKIGTVVVRIPLKGGGRVIIGKVSRRYAGDLLIEPSFTSDAKGALIKRIDKMLHISKGKAFRTRLPNVNLTIEWSCVSA